MSKIQRYKIEFQGANFFFVDRAFDSAYRQAQKFIKRNRGRASIKLYMLNVSSFGKKWLLIEEVTNEA